MTETGQESQLETKEAASRLIFSIRDNERILLRDGSVITIDIDAPKLASCVKGEMDLLKSGTTIPVYMGSRTLAEVLQERVGGFAGTLVNTIQRSLEGNPDGIFWQKEGSECLYLNTPSLLRKGGNDPEGQKEILAVAFAHELNHLERYFNRAARKSDQTNNVLCLGFMFWGGVNGVFSTVSIFNRLAKNPALYSRRKFLEKAALATMTAAGLLSMAAYNRIFYNYLATSECESRKAAQSTELVDKIKETLSIHQDRP